MGCVITFWTFALNRHTERDQCAATVCRKMILPSHDCRNESGKLLLCTRGQDCTQEHGLLECVRSKKCMFIGEALPFPLRSTQLAERAFISCVGLPLLRAMAEQLQECAEEQTEEIEALGCVYFDRFRAIDVQSQPFAFEIAIEMELPSEDCSLARSVQ